MSLFDIDYTALSKMLLPVRLRGARMLAWLTALAEPVVSLYNSFSANRAANLYTLAHNSQVIRIEAVLNDAFDAVLRRIAIDDPELILSTYVFLRAENKKRYIYRSTEADKTYIRRTVETIGHGPSFIIQVPAGLAFDEARMKALVNEYRLASKTFKIVIV